MCKCLIILFTAFLLLSSCCKDIPTPAFTAEDLAWMPYKDGDTLKMRGNNGKQLWLRFSDMRGGVENSYPRRAGFGPCPDDKYIGRAFTVRPVEKLLANQSYDTTNFEVLNINGFNFYLSRYVKSGLKVKLSYEKYFDLDSAIASATFDNGVQESIYKDSYKNWNAKE